MIFKEFPFFFSDTDMADIDNICAANVGILRPCALDQSNTCLPPCCKNGSHEGECVYHHGKFIIPECPIAYCTEIGVILQSD